MAAGENKERQKREGVTADITSGPREASAIDAAQIVIGFLGTLLVLVYPLGLITFLVQLGQAHNFDYGTALYATSLIPTSTTAARLLPILGWSLFAAVLAMLASYWYGSGVKNWLEVPIWYGLLFAALLVGTWLFKDEVNWFEVVLILVFVVLVAGASYAFFVFRRQVAQVDNSRTSGNGSVRLNWGLIRTGAIASLCTLLAAASMTATVHTYLPFMKLCLGEEESARIVTMLSVANETWYVIEGKTLVSYPADEVKRAESIPNQNFVQRPGIPTDTPRSCVR